MISSPQMTPMQTYPQAQNYAAQAPQAQPAQTPQGQPVQQAPQGQPAQAPQGQQPQVVTPAPVSGPSASAVTIQIFNPTAYGSASPVANPTPGYYEQIPQSSVYAQPAGGIQQAPYVAPAPLPTQPVNTAPPSVINQPAPDVNNTQNQPEVEKNVSAVPAPAPEAPAQMPNVDVQSFNARLTSPDLNEQTNAMSELAKLCDQSKESASRVLDNSIMTNLANIIAADTSSLQGPTQEQINVALKEQNGEQLTPQEQQIAQQSSPKEIAEKNKVYAMFTLAMMQKQLREELDEFIAANPQENVAPLNIPDMIGFNEIQNAIKTTQVPAVRLAGIEALSYIASKPEDKEVLDAIILPYANDADKTIQEAVYNAYAKLGVPLQSQAQTPAPQTAPDASEAVEDGGKKHHRKKKDKKV